MRSICILLALTLAIVPVTFSQTVVPPGNVSGGWTAPGSPYLIQGDITVPFGSTLIIDPGVTLIFQGHFGLGVQGTLLAVGTAVDPIIFTVNDTTGFSMPDTTLGGWAGIQLINTPQSNDSTILAYCKLEYGKAISPTWPGNSGGAIHVANYKKVRVSNCTVTHNMSGGSSLPGGGGIALTGADAILEGNLIAGNYSTGQGGGLLLNGSTTRSSHNRYVGNITPGAGGGVLIEGMCNLQFEGDSLAGNVSSGSGGGLFAYGQTKLVLDGVSFFENTANWGGGLAVPNCTLQVQDCSFQGNTSTLDGGGIGASFTSMNIDGSMISSNRTVSEGGGIYGYRSDLRLRSSMFTANRAGFDSLSGMGGAIYAERSSLLIDSCVFQYDTAWYSAGIRALNSDLVADSVLVQGEVAFSQLGGLYWYADSTYFGRPFELSLVRTHFLKNKAGTVSAGAMIAQPADDSTLADAVIDRCEFTENSCSITPALTVSGTFRSFAVSNTIFQRNSAGSRTSGLSFAGGTKATVENCLFSGNTTAPGTSSVGAGISMGQSSKVNIVNCTFARNVAGSGSALSIRGGAQARIINTVFWKNSGKYISLASSTGLGGHLNLNYSCVQQGQDSIVVDSLSTLVWGPGVQSWDLVAAVWDTLRDDCHLKGNSRCIQAGIDSLDVDGVMLYAPLTDLDGLPRPMPVGTPPDLGAFEEPYPPEAVGPESGKPMRFSLEQNYPNPFNPSTVISYSVPPPAGRDLASSGAGGGQLSAVSNVKLVVYDILGREVAILVNEKKAPGSYQVTFNAAGVSSGVYFYRLTAGTFVQTRKMLLLH